MSHLEKCPEKENCALPLTVFEQEELTLEPSSSVSIETIISELGSSPKYNIAAILKNGPGYLGSQEVLYTPVDEAPSIDLEADQQIVIPLEGGDRTITLKGLDKTPSPEKLKTYCRLLQQQEHRIRDYRRLETIRKYTDTLFDSCPQGIVVTDTKGYVTAVNRAFVALTRQPRESLVATRPTNLINKDGRANLFQAIRELQNNKRASFTFQSQISRNRSLEISATITAFSLNKEELFLTTLQDLNSESLAQEHSALDKQLSCSIEQATDCFLTFNHSGHITEVNPFTGRLLGTTSVRLLGRSISDIFTVSSLRAFRKALTAVHNDGYSSLNCSLNQADGSEIPARGILMRFEIDGQLHFRLILQDTRSWSTAKDD